MKRLVILGCLAVSLSMTAARGQTLQMLYDSARQQAYASEYKQAKKTLDTLLLSDAQHDDARLLLAQIHAWDGDYRSALALLSELTQKPQTSVEAYEMMARVRMWQDQCSSCLETCKTALALFPDYLPVRFLSAQALVCLGEENQAIDTLNAVLASDSSHVEAQRLLDQLQRQQLKNSVGIEYSYAHFSNTFSPWHSTALSYRRNTGWGPVIARATYAYRFDQTDVQYEVDAYPRLSKRSYAYLNAGVSHRRVFPAYRYGAEYFRLLPGRFEISGGVRGLYFDPVHVLIYTLQAGRYLDHYWISARGFLASVEQRKELTGSFTLRRYLADPDHYFTLYATSGATPVQVVALSEIRRLQAQSIGLDYQYPAWNKTLLIGGKAVYQQEVYEEIRATRRITLSVSLEKRF